MTAHDSYLIDSLDQLIPLYLRALRTALADAVGDDRLTMQQLRCLQAVAAAGDDPITTTKLAELMSVSVPTMSSMLDGMSGRGLVERRALPDDRRRVPLFITEQGRALLGHYQSIMDARHREIIAGLTGGERDLIEQAVALLVGQLTRLEAGEPNRDSSNMGSMVLADVRE